MSALTRVRAAWRELRVGQVADAEVHCEYCCCPVFCACGREMYSERERPGGLALWYHRDDDSAICGGNWPPNDKTLIPGIDCMLAGRQAGAEYVDQIRSVRVGRSDDAICDEAEADNEGTYRLYSVTSPAAVRDSQQATARGAGKAVGAPETQPGRGADWDLLDPN